MLKRLLLLAGAAVVLGTAAGAQAQDRREFEHEVYRLHQECDRGERRACVRFGMIMGEHHELHAEWRRNHPEFFWWER